MILASEALWLPYGASWPSKSNDPWTWKSIEIPMKNQWFLDLRPLDSLSGPPGRLRQMIGDLQKVLKYIWKINDSYVSGPLSARQGLLAISVESSFDVRRALRLHEKHIGFLMEIQWFPQFHRGGGGPLQPPKQFHSGGGRSLKAPNRQHHQIITKPLKFLWKY